MKDRSFDQTQFVLYEAITEGRFIADGSALNPTQAQSWYIDYVERLYEIAFYMFADIELNIAELIEKIYMTIFAYSRTMRDQYKMEYDLKGLKKTESDDTSYVVQTYKVVNFIVRNVLNSEGNNYFMRRSIVLRQFLSKCLYTTCRNFFLAVVNVPDDPRELTEEGIVTSIYHVLNLDLPCFKPRFTMF